MDLAAILAKFTGVVLFAWTLRSIYKHFFAPVKQKQLAVQAVGPASQTIDKKQSMTEAFLNNILLYLWLAFMLAFSMGMVINN